MTGDQRDGVGVTGEEAWHEIAAAAERSGDVAGRTGDRHQGATVSVA